MLILAAETVPKKDMNLNMTTPTENTLPAMKNILSYEIPDALLNSIPTGNAWIDRLFAGDGILPSTVTLITGLPGSGKTSCMFQLADCITAQGFTAIYNGTEESVIQMRRTTKRFKLRNGFLVNDEACVQRIIENANAVQTQNPDKRIFLFVDSLQTVYVESDTKRRGRPISPQTMQVSSVDLLTQWAKATYNVVFIVGQVTKDGDFLGKQEVKHLVDCHLHMGIDSNRKSDQYGERFAEMTKNRFGQAHIGYHFDLFEHGVVFKDTSE